MKKLHIHLSVQDLNSSIQFYSVLFNEKPSVIHDDYAKWELIEPAVNFAISNRREATGLNHLGIQTDSNQELEGLAQQLQQADITGLEQNHVNCCYARSNKHWVIDPDGIAWEGFHTLAQAALYGEDTPSKENNACCMPSCCN